MPRTWVIPYTVEVAIKGNRNGDPRVTVLHYRHGTTQPAPNVAGLVEVATWVGNNIVQYIAANATSQTQWTEVRATYVGNLVGLQGVYSMVPIVQGVRGEDPLPGNVNHCLAKKTGLALPWAKGRLFIPDIAENVQSNAHIVDSGYQTRLLQLVGQLLLHFATTGNSWSPAVGSVKHQLFADIIAIAYELITDSLRTRLEGHRRVKRTHTPA